MNIPKATARFIVLTLILFACTKDRESSWTLQKSRLKKSFLATNKILMQSFKNSVENYSQKMDYFTLVPAPHALADCKSEWINCYNEFLQLSALRYIDGSLNHGFSNNETNLDEYGIDYSYIDYTDSSPNSGIINDVSNYPVINANNLVDWHQVGGEEKVTLGFHSIEFLLWGEDLSYGIPGQRTNDDYLQNSTENERRMDFLDAAWTQLNYDLFYIDIDDAYENTVLAMNEDEFFNDLIDGYIKFLEDDYIASIEVPLNSQSQYDEISDFSDNTLQNLKSKFQSLKYAFDGSEFFEEDQNTWYFLINFIEDLEPSLANNISSSLTEIEDLLGEITMDFDAAILNATMRAKLNDLIVELETVKSDLETFRSAAS